MKRRRLFQNPKARNRVLEKFNRFTLADVGRAGGEQGMKVLQEMKEMGARGRDWRRFEAS
jgi:hypothetical protein